MRNMIGAATWRRTAYAVTVLPLSVACLLACLAGRPEIAGRWYDRAATRLLGTPLTDGRARPGLANTAVLGLAGLPIGAASWLVALLLGPNTVRNLTYPLWVDGPADYVNAWGGPSLAGVWAVHGGGALLMVPLLLALLSGLAALHRRLAERVFLGRTAWWPVPSTFVVTAGTVLLTVGLTHQV